MKGYRSQSQQGLQRLAVPIAGTLLLIAQVGCAVPLLNASSSGDTQKVMRLLQEGHHANEAFPIIGTSPLMVAAANGHIETAKALLDAGADVNAQDVTGWTALHAGAFNGNAAIVSLLLEHGAVPNRSRWFLQTPARMAEALGHKDVVPLLKRTEFPLSDDLVSPSNNKAPQ